MAEGAGTLSFTVFAFCIALRSAIGRRVDSAQPLRGHLGSAVPTVTHLDGRNTVLRPPRTSTYEFRSRKRPLSLQQRPRLIPATPSGAVPCAVFRCTRIPNLPLFLPSWRVGTTAGQRDPWLIRGKCLEKPVVWGSRTLTSRIIALWGGAVSK